MKKLIGWPARLGVALGLVMALAACGGGGGDPGANVPPGGVEEPTIRWSIQSVGTETSMIYPGGTYDPVGGEPPYALWLDHVAGGTVLKEAVASATGRGLTTTTRVANLPLRANNNATVVMTAGGWWVTVWTEPGNELFVRLSGAGYDSGSFRLSTNFAGAAWEVRAAVNASGHVRIFWDEPARVGAHGSFLNGVWTVEVDTGQSMARIDRYMVSPGGEGFVFYTNEVGGELRSFVRSINATTGLGAETRLDDPTDGRLMAGRGASAEGTQGFTTVGLQRVPLSTSACLAIRRMVAGVLQPVQCLSLTGDALPNGNYVNLSSNAAGQALLVWSAGDQDRALYAARRNMAGTWSAAVKLANVTGAGQMFSWLSGLKTAVSVDGQALVVFRALGSADAPAVTRALVASASGNWSAVSTLTQPGMGNLSASLAFNAQGVPGVLQLVRGGDDSAVLMSTRSNGSWTTERLRSNIRLNSFQPLRLTPQGDAGWLAMWEEDSPPPGPAASESRLWLAEFR